VVALTFDDGPNDFATAAILDALAAAGVPATFFVFGSRAAEHPQLIARMLDESHAVHPHCWWSHASHHELSRPELESDIGRTLEALERLGCPRPRFWRPPNGDIEDPLSYEVAAAHDLELAVWTLQTCDWKDARAASLILSEIARESRPDAVLREDSVVLMHDVPEGPPLVAGLVELMGARGYEAGPLGPDSSAIARGGDFRFGRRDGVVPCGLEG
jgi:peptidoglycan/xylan/chitin deacetylase (PgdA/CDA1 family)